MKKYLLFLMVIPLLFSCTNDEAEKKLQAQIDSMKQVSGTDAATIEEYMKAFNDIRSNLDVIKEKEKIISTATSGNVELDVTEKDRINEDINSIYDLMLENKKKMTYLKNKMKNSDSQIGEFKKTIQSLSEEMNKKNDEITDLKNKLEKMNMDMAELNDKINGMSENITELSTENTEKAKEISEQDKLLHTAYYIIGTKEELTAKGIISTEGKVLGMGGVHKIHPKTEAFTEIDIRKMSSLSLNSAKKAQILSQHPNSTFSLKQDSDEKYESLEISDAENFWSMSKYLVIIVK